MSTPIEIELTIVDPIELSIETAPDYHIGSAISGPTGPQGEQGETGPAWTFDTGAKYSSTDEGTFGDASIDDDYLYICVETGTAGNAKWKKTPLFLST